MSKQDFIRCAACGHGTDIKPEEPFVLLQVSVHDSQYMGVFVGDRKQVELYACPKCGTVKMNLNG